MEAPISCSFYCWQRLFNEKYAINGLKATYLGTGFNEKWVKEHGVPYTFCDGEIKLAEHLYVVGNFKRNYNFETIPERFKVMVDDKLQGDNFSDEICLVCDFPDGLFVVVGCSHLGILNILSTVHNRFNKKILGIVGDNHLKDAEEKQIRRTVDVLHRFGIKYLGFNHCSGGTL